MSGRPNHPNEKHPDDHAGASIVTLRGGEVHEPGEGDPTKEQNAEVHPEMVVPTMTAFVEKENVEADADDQAREQHVKNVTR